MPVPVEVTFGHVGRSEAVEADIRERAAKLERLHDRITGCHVVVEAPHRHHHKRTAYRVRVDLNLPGTELVAVRDPAKGRTHDDIHVAVRDAFRAAERRLKRFTHERRRQVEVLAVCRWAHRSRTR